jgi:hypothetical protein
MSFWVASKSPEGNVPKRLCRPSADGRQSHFFRDFDATLATDFMSLDTYKT